MKLAYLAAAALCSAAPASAAWHEARSKHFIVYADEDSKELREYAEKLERFDAAVREARGVPDVQEGAATRVTLFIVRDLNELKRIYGDRDSGVAGFYMAKSSGSVAFVPESSGRTGKFRLNPQSIFFHEYTHHLMLQDSDRPLPTWLTEGFAEFFANPGFNPDGSVVIGIPPSYRANILYATKAEQMPLRTMLSGDYTRVTQDEYLTLYGRGWLLTHLLSFDLKRRGQLTRYLNAIQAGVDPLKAAENAFGDLKQFDRELDAYFKKQSFTVTTIPASKLKVPPVTIRPLREGEAKMMRVRLYLERGGKELKAKELAGAARGIARQYPADPAVLTTLARFELEAGYPAAALQAADRAIQLDPKSDQALLAKSKAMIELAKAAPKSADWTTIRKTIARANRIDPENAEPLVLFYRTFVAEGVAPPKNAMDGLQYAVALVPRDHELRLELVGQLIDHNRLSDARRVLIPLAYSPHQGKWRTAVLKVFEDITAGRRAEARKNLDASLRFFRA